MSERMSDERLDELTRLCAEIPNGQTKIRMELLAALRAERKAYGTLAVAASAVCDGDDGCGAICEEHDGEPQCVGNGDCLMQDLRAITGGGVGVVA